MTGRITNIQRFSLHDGPGIRTTVFFHGCHMRCRWCHNPETLCAPETPLFYASKCIGCGACYKACPTGARGADFRGCTGCGACVEVCWTGALCRAAREVTVEEAMREIRQDKLYYDESGGGLTLSGGEALDQLEFAEALTEAALAEGIRVAVETNLLHPFERIRPLLERMSCIMADIKLIDDAAHRAWTGVSNAPVLENARLLGTLGIPLILRTPLIPGATDGEENLRRIGELVRDIPNVRYWELLNFNPLGADKYTALRQENPIAAARPLPKAALDRIAETVRDLGVEVRIG